jgi:hypothetical protein
MRVAGALNLSDYQRYSKVAPITREEAVGIGGQELMDQRLRDQASFSVVQVGNIFTY